MVSMSSAPHPFSIPDYRRYWLARFMAVIATMSMVVVIAWQVYDVARTDYGMSPKAAAFQLGLLGLFQFIPLALLTPGCRLGGGPFRTAAGRDFCQYGRRGGCAGAWPFDLS
jgi:hypothetical protein